MKKAIFLFSILLLGGSRTLEAHTILGDASNITRGTLDPARVSPDTFTLQGNKLNFSTIATAVDGLSASTTALNVAIGGILKRSFDLYIGTPGSPGVDVFVSSRSNWELAMASVGLNGNYNVSYPTVTAKIFMQSGLYFDMDHSSIPAGADIVCGSSTVWVVKDGNAAFLTNYGQINGLKVDFAGIGLASKMISLKHDSKFTNFTLYNDTGLAQGPSNTGSFCVLCVNNSSNTKAQGDWRDIITLQDPGNEGANAYFKIWDSTGADVQINPDMAAVQGYCFPNNVCSFMHVLRSDSVNIHDGQWTHQGGGGLVIDSRTSNLRFERNTVYLSTFVSSNSLGWGYIGFSGRWNSAGFTSTGTISVSYNTVIVSTAGFGNFMYASAAGATAANGIQGLVVRGNNLSVVQQGTYDNGVSGGTGSSALKMFTIASACRNCIFQNNLANGITFMFADTGVGSVYVSQGNILNGVEQ